ncbi:MAG TPA: ROK family protein [Anaerolineales bacterium]|nr:ROK family protein [Anaerolineales bacterium]
MSSPREQYAIGIDIGATKIASVLLSKTGELVTSSQVLTRADQGMQTIFDKVADQILALARQCPGELVGVGVGSPGKVDSEHGKVYNAINLGWTEANLAEEVASRLGQLANMVPLWIQKDANLSALGEYYFGACQGLHDFIYLGIGSGLGAGIISSGHLITGGDWYAADVGHLSVDPDGLTCVCGSQGCAETIASGPGLVRVTIQKLAMSPGRSMLSNKFELTSTDVLSAAREGDALSLQALAEVGRVLGMIMSACTAILNPSRYVVGGGLGLAGFDFIVPAAREELMRRTIPESRSLLEIVPSRVESPAIGAACLVWYSLSGKVV